MNEIISNGDAVLSEKYVNKLFKIFYLIEEMISLGIINDNNRGFFFNQIVAKIHEIFKVKSYKTGKKLR